MLFSLSARNRAVVVFQITKQKRMCQKISLLFGRSFAGNIDKGCPVRYYNPIQRETIISHVIVSEPPR